jgi:hypothetical protein
MLPSALKNIFFAKKHTSVVVGHAVVVIFISGRSFLHICAQQVF